VSGPRRLAVLALLGGALVLAAPAAAAQEAPRVGTARAIAELDRARALLDRALALYRQGRIDQAFTAARDAYLDHFELVEIPLRVRDEALTLALEERFATLRTLIRAGAPESEVRAQVVEIREGLDRVERRLSEPGLGAPALAFGFSFVTLFREGLEAVLVVAAILGFLAASRNERHRGAVLAGVGAALVATAITFVVATLVIRLAPLERELLEAATTLLAVVVLFYVSFWLVARLEQRRWMEFLRAKVWTAAATGSSLALAGVGFTAVYREGFETTLFYQALLFFAEGLEAWVALGAAAAALVLAAIGVAVFRAGRRIPARQFLAVAVAIVMGLSVAFIGNAVRGLQEAAVLPVTFLRGAPRLPIFLAELTGYHPTLETILAQAALTAVYLAGAAWVFVLRPRRERGRVPAAAPGEAPVPAGDVEAASGG
jgi:high-affinity iron transporter